MIVSKYFPISELYAATSSFSDHSCMMEMYGAIRQILKDPNVEKNRKYSVGTKSSDYKSDGVTWHIFHYPRYSHIETEVFIIPLADLPNSGALLVKMGARTQQEAWDEYKDLWYEDLERVLAHIEKGTGP